jgi:hypothetical protein
MLFYLLLNVQKNKVEIENNILNLFYCLYL